MQICRVGLARLSFLKERMTQKNQKFILRKMLITYYERLLFMQRTMGNKRLCYRMDMKITWLLMSFHLLNQALAHLMHTNCKREVSLQLPPLPKGQGLSSPFQRLGVVNQVT
ncbi:hypothetical protein V6Z12_A10G204000 [Gossypium hirsutum]